MHSPHLTQRFRKFRSSSDPGGRINSGSAPAALKMGEILNRGTVMAAARAEPITCLRLRSIEVRAWAESAQEVSLRNRMRRHFGDKHHRSFRNTGILSFSRNPFYPGWLSVAIPGTNPAFRASFADGAPKQGKSGENTKQCA